MRFSPTFVLPSLMLLSAVPLAAGRGAARARQGAALQGVPVAGRPRAYVSLSPVPRGKKFQAAVVLDILPGYHMNSHKPTDPYLIPTILTANLPSGFQLAATVYPEGRLEKFPFSPDKPLSVYTGTVTFRLRLAAQANAPLGPATIPLTIRYQACNDTTCFPPVNVPVSISLEVAPAGTKSHAVHAEIFSAAPAQP